jgi:centrosomal protein CEP135
LKRKLDALQYSQPLSFESAALAEKLLNDLLKSTEAFNKLKKMND